MFEKLKTYLRNIFAMPYEAVRRLPRNTKGRDFIVGDLHGAFHLLDRALAESRFDPLKDRVISVGDLINRGPASIRCLEFLDKPWFHAVRGNHEQYFIDRYETAGMRLDLGTVTEDSAWLLKETPRTIKKIYRKLKSLPFAMEIETAQGMTGIVHADIPQHTGWKKFTRNLKRQEDNTIKAAIYGRTRIQTGFKNPVEGIDRIYLGHIVQPDGPTILGNCFYIDTGATYRTENKKNLCLTFAEISAKSSSFKKAKKKNRAVNLIHR